MTLAHRTCWGTALRVNDVLMRLVSHFWIGASYGPAPALHKTNPTRRIPGITRMARPRLRISEAPAPPERGVRASTFQLLLDTAMALIRSEGRVPSVAAMAQQAKVSRATAYRYFPSRSVLTTAVIDSSLGPVRRLSDDGLAGRERLHQLFKKTFPRFKEFEAQLRLELLEAREGLLE